MTTHVEAIVETSRDAGSIPAASTHAGVTTRLKAKQARQLILASFLFLNKVSRDYRAPTNCRHPQSRHSLDPDLNDEKGSTGPKGSEPQHSPK